jgi:hypothetical protein
MYFHYTHIAYGTQVTRTVRPSNALARQPQHGRDPQSGWAVFTGGLFAVKSFRCAPVAQLDRAAGFEPVGRGFESLRARQIPKALSLNSPS